VGKQLEVMGWTGGGRVGARGTPQFFFGVDHFSGRGFTRPVSGRFWERNVFLGCCGLRAFFSLYPSKKIFFVSFSSKGELAVDRSLWKGD